MDYQQEQLYIAIGKFVTKEIEGTITAQEKEHLENVLNANPVNRMVYNELMNAQHRESLLQEVQQFDSDSAFKRFEQKIQKKPASRITVALAIAAAMAGIAIGILFYTNRNAQAPHPDLVSVTDVAPGGNRATLTLSNGKVITLTNQKAGVITSEAGVTITKNSDGQLVYTTGKEDNIEIAEKRYNTVSTPVGGQYQVTLPDGSKVWLNAASTLSYAPSLRERGDDKRRVRLTGEAYFQIAKDKLHPFVVTTAGQEVEVLGTQFNVNSYDNEAATRTTLLEGSVRIHLSHSPSVDKLLKPGQQAALTANRISISEADQESATAWKDGLFVFKNADVPTVMRQLSRWYDIDVEFGGPIPKDLFTGGISRQSNLSTVLKMLELIKIRTKVVQTEQGKKLIVNP